MSVDVAGPPAGEGRREGGMRLNLCFFLSVPENNKELVVQHITDSKFGEEKENKTRKNRRRSAASYALLILADV